MASIQEDFFGNKGPASTLVGVTAPAQPGWLIEAEASKQWPPSDPAARRHRDRFALAVVGHELAVLPLLN